MAMIICPECGKEVSNTTKTCVHCGYVLKTPKKEINLKLLCSKKWLAILVVIIIGIVVFALKPEKNPFEGLDKYPSRNDVLKLLGNPDEEYTGEDEISGNTYYIDGYDFKLCGLDGKLEIRFNTSQKDLARKVVWKYIIPENYTDKKEDQCIQKLVKWFDKKYGAHEESSSLDGLYAWKDASGDKYTLFYNKVFGFIWIERW